MARTVKADPFWSHSLSQHFSVSVMDGRQKGDNRLQRYPASWQCVEAAVKRNISKCPVITADLGETWEPHASSVLVCGGIIGSGQAATQTPDSQWVRGDSVLPTQTLSSSLLGDTGTDKLKENRTWINLKRLRLCTLKIFFPSCLDHRAQISMASRYNFPGNRVCVKVIKA